MAKIKRLKDKSGVMHTLGDADVSAYESTLSGAATNVPYSTAVKAYADSVAATAASNLAAHANNQNNPHNVTKAQVGLGNVENKSSATIRGEITKANVTNALGFTPIDSAKMGVAGGVATLDNDGKVPASQLPSYVDDVIEGYLYNGKFYQDSAHTIEITALSGKIYVDITNGVNKTYRWSGTAYVEISSSLALGETASTAYRGDRGKIAYDHSQVSGDSTIHHTHSNKSTLDGVTDAKISGYDTHVANTSNKATASAYGHAKASSTTPNMDGSASVGSQVDQFARGDHRHPSDTSRVAVYNQPSSEAGKVLLYAHTRNSSGEQADGMRAISTTALAADAGTIVQRTSDSQIHVPVTPSAGTNATSKQYVDTLAGNKADKVSSATSGNFAGLDSNGNLTDSGKKASDFKTVQSAKSSPSASGNAIAFIDTITQNTNGEITATKKTVPNVSSSQNGLMTSANLATLNAAATKSSVDALTTRVTSLESKGLNVTSDDDGYYVEFV